MIRRFGHSKDCRQMVLSLMLWQRIGGLSRIVSKRTMAAIKARG